VQENKMKTKVLSIVAMLAATAAFAQTNQVLSKNAVGYVRQDVPPLGLFTLVASPFIPLNPTNGPGTITLQDVLPVTSGLKNSTNPNQVDKIYLWDVIAQQYITLGMKPAGTFHVLAGYGTNPPVNPVLSLGEGFWIQSPSSVATSHPVYVMGEVPSLNNATNNMAVAYQFRANPYPVTKSIDELINTNFGAKGTANPNTCDQVLIWQTNQTYLSLGLKTPTNRWWPLNSFATSSYPVVMIEPGQAFWYRNRATTNFTWTVAKPYTWP
jgi:hypothetical protein